LGFTEQPSPNNDGYARINSLLRNLVGIKPETVKSAFIHVVVLSNALRKLSSYSVSTDKRAAGQKSLVPSPSEPVAGYRRFHSDFAHEFRSNAPVKKTAIEHGFLSVSKDTPKEKFGESQMQFVTGKLVPIWIFSKYPNERELLCPPSHLQSLSLAPDESINIKAVSDIGLVSTHQYLQDTLNQELIFPLIQVRKVCEEKYHALLEAIIEFIQIIKKTNSDIENETISSHIKEILKLIDEKKDLSIVDEAFKQKFDSILSDSKMGLRCYQLNHKTLSLFHKEVKDKLMQMKFVNASHLPILLGGDQLPSALLSAVAQKKWSMVEQLIAIPEIKKNEELLREVLQSIVPRNTLVIHHSALHIATIINKQIYDQQLTVELICYFYRKKNLKNLLP